MKRAKGSWTLVGAMTVLLSLCLGLLYPWWHTTGYHLVWEWGKQTDSAVNISARTVPETFEYENTHNFQNILSF